MTVTNLFECPVCGHQKYADVTVYGDYDGQDGPSELVNCESCTGIKMASPALWNRMKLLSDKIKQERADCAGKVEACRRRMIDPGRASRLLHSPFALDSFFRAYKKEFSELMEIDGASTGWAHRHACRRMIFAYLKKAGETRVTKPKSKAVTK